MSKGSFRHTLGCRELACVWGGRLWRTGEVGEDEFGPGHENVVSGGGEVRVSALHKSVGYSISGATWFGALSTAWLSSRGGAAEWATGRREDERTTVLSVELAVIVDSVKARREGLEVK